MKRVYLAIPYTGMEESSYEQATRVAGKMLGGNINVFSPITHSHPLKDCIPKGFENDWNFWQNIDFSFIHEWCDEVWVLIPEEGIDKVKNSTGVQGEVEFAIGLHIPVYYIVETDTFVRIEFNHEEI